MRRVLVTGGAGLIGSNIIKELNSRGHNNIIVCDILGKDDKYKNLIGLDFNDYVEYDKNIFQTNIFSDITHIYHLGACSSTTEVDMSYLYEVNTNFSKKLAQISIEKDIRFVYASSAATYGDGSAGMMDTEDILHFKPLNKYGFSKQLFDIFASKNNFFKKITGLKYFNIFGPGEEHKGDMKSLVNKSISQIADSGSINLFKSYKNDYKDGEQKRDFLYVKDAAKITIDLSMNLDAIGLFNVGSGVANSWNYLAECIFNSLNKTCCINYIDMPDKLKNKYQYFTQANISKLYNYLPDLKITSLQDAVRDYVTNHLIKNENSPI